MKNSVLEITAMVDRNVKKSEFLDKAHKSTYSTPGLFTCPAYG